MSTEESLERNRKKRGIIRTAITKLIKKLDDELKREDPKTDAIQDSLTILSERETALFKLDEIIENQIETNDLEAEIENSMECSQAIILCKSRVKRYLGNLNNSTVLERANVESSSDSRTCVNTKLPRISLDKFGGDICKFQEFWPQFKAAIHENEALQDIEKFNYLKSLLSDSAATAISGLPLTAENYKKAVEILTDRFGKKDVLISAHMNRLLNLQPIRNSNDVFALRKLYDEISIQIRSLESLQVHSNSYGCLLLPLLYQSIPHHFVLQFNREQISGKEPSVTDLLNFLKKEIEAREKSLNVNSTHENQRSNENKFKPNFTRSNPTKPKIPSAMALNTVTDILCPFCNDKHKPESCSLNLQQRRDSLRKQAKCYRCFKKLHRKIDCRARIQCLNCHSKGHQRSLCEQENQTKHKQSEPAEAQRENEIVVTSLIPRKLNTDCANDSYVYFQTVKCKAIGLNKIIDVRLLLDSGSQRSFINKNISESLELQATGNESLKIHTFGSTDAPVTTQKRVRILLKDIYSDAMLSLEALETEKICANVIHAPSTELHAKLQNLGIRLSDIPDESGKKEKQIDILVGSDFYWCIMTGKNKRLSSNVVLNETKFGWSLHGKFCNAFDSNNLVNAMHVAIWDDDNDEERTSVQIQRFFDLESLGIKEEPTDKNLCDEQALKQFEASIQFKNNRYEAKLPKKFDTFDLPNNYDIAKTRFQGLIKRFQNNPALFKDYKAIIDEYISLGIVEEVQSQDINSTNGNLTYYLPHHPVIRKIKVRQNYVSCSMLHAIHKMSHALIIFYYQGHI